MRKLILGIVAVICLDIGFIAYMGTGRTAETTSMAGIPEAYRSNSSVDLGNDRIEIWRFSDGPIEVKTEKIASTNNVRQKSSAAASLLSNNKGRRLPAAIGSPRPSDLTAQFKPVVIEYKKAHDGVKTFDRNPQINEPAKQDGPRVDNKSFIAKALPIIKKPYDWIKAIGAKMK